MPGTAATSTPPPRCSAGSPAAPKTPPEIIRGWTWTTYCAGWPPSGLSSPSRTAPNRPDRASGRSRSSTGSGWAPTSRRWAAGSGAGRDGSRPPPPSSGSPPGCGRWAWAVPLCPGGCRTWTPAGCGGGCPARARWSSGCPSRPRTCPPTPSGRASSGTSPGWTRPCASGTGSPARCCAATPPPGWSAPCACCWTGSRPRRAPGRRSWPGALLADGGALAGTGSFVHEPGLGVAFVRRSCCLYYRVPGGGLCGDCVLRTR
ncbi:(2Fe-2S)-binding protein [Streptomyces katrae]|uniref:(2Fe-2S)-binding protein n=1 Tax=Streptomyces katrae TaxID=68223 RepID=UPI003307C250